jgi:hypothetical protein
LQLNMRAEVYLRERKRSNEPRCIAAFKPPAAALAAVVNAPMSVQVPPHQRR